MIVRLLTVVGVLLVAPGPLRGVPLQEPTGVRLLVASNPPFVLDVDTGRVTRVRGLNTRGRPVLVVRPAGRDAIIWLNRPLAAATVPTAEIYVLRRGTTRTTLLATAWEVAPAADGRAVWLKSYRRPGRCHLREVTLDGRQRHKRRAVPCSSRLIDGGAGPLLVHGSTVRDPASGRTVLRGGTVWAATGDFVLLYGGSRRMLTLWDRRNGQKSALRWPSAIGGRDEAAVQRRGGLVALAFSDPAYEGSGTQVTDLWLLDPASRDLRQLPDMPATVSLKRTSMRWSSDGRLVILGETAGRQVVAVWRPGQERIEVGNVRLPARTSGSDSFVVWRG